MTERVEQYEVLYHCREASDSDLYYYRTDETIFVSSKLNITDGWVVFCLQHYIDSLAGLNELRCYLSACIFKIEINCVAAAFNLNYDIS